MNLAVHASLKFFKRLLHNSKGAVAILSGVCRLSNRSGIRTFDSNASANLRLKLEAVDLYSELAGG
jgi:hypothetical protein